MFCSDEDTGGRREFGYLLIQSSVVAGGAVAGTTDDFRSHNHIDQQLILCGMGNTVWVHTVYNGLNVIYHTIVSEQNIDIAPSVRLLTEFNILMYNSAEAPRVGNGNL